MEENKTLLNEREKKNNNRRIMHRLIDITLCLGIGGKPFCGHNEKDTDVHRGLFLDLVRLLKKYDPILKEHFDSGPLEQFVRMKRLLLSTDAQSIFNSLCEIIEQYDINGN
ncbi:hypothetical protein QTP88_006553 [Uroleucon formosanum]